MKNLIILATLLTVAITLEACGKKKVDPHIPPAVQLKESTNYIFADKVVGKNDTLLVGLIAEKTEDDLKTFNVSYRYDGNPVSSTFYNYVMTVAENSYYEKDVQIITRATGGTEQWLFTIVDRDGNMSQKVINLTVQ